MHRLYNNLLDCFARNQAKIIFKISQKSILLILNDFILIFERFLGRRPIPSQIVQNSISCFD